MRNKFVIRKLYIFKTAKRPPVQQKNKRMREKRENSARERGAEFEGINNALMAISLESTVG
jgi:hypothetical protein